MLNCPRCGLFSPDTAERCDCGYHFASGQFGSMPPPSANDLLTGFFPLSFVFVAMIGYIGSFLAVMGTQAMNGNEATEQLSAYFFRWFTGSYGAGSVVALVAALMARHKTLAFRMYLGFLVGMIGGVFGSTTLATAAVSRHRMSLVAWLLVPSIPAITGVVAAWCAIVIADRHGKAASAGHHA